MAATFNNPNAAFPADIMTPGSGNETYFFDLSNNGLLSYMTPDRVVHQVITDDASCCACDIAKDFSARLACGVADGVIKMADLQTFITTGFSVTATEGVTNGVKTCTVTINTGS